VQDTQTGENSVPGRGTVKDKAGEEAITFYGDGTFSSSGPGEPGSVKRTGGRPFLIGSASERRT
jgi:hypothetical protein